MPSYKSKKKAAEKLAAKRTIMITFVLMLCLASGTIIVVLALQPEEAPDTTDVPFSIKELAEKDLSAWVAVCESLAAMRREGEFQMLATTIPAFAAEIRARADIEPKIVFALCKAMSVRFSAFVLTTDAIVSAYIMDEVLQSYGAYEAQETEEIGPEIQLPEMPEDAPPEVAQAFERLYASAQLCPARIKARPKMSPVQNANTTLVLSNRERIDAAWYSLLEAGMETEE
jgi:hypothetical protein